MNPFDQMHEYEYPFSVTGAVLGYDDGDEGYGDKESTGGFTYDITDIFVKGSGGEYFCWGWDAGLALLVSFFLFSSIFLTHLALHLAMAPHQLLPRTASSSPRDIR
ncbi:hypothetical protein C8J56DRAFT_1060470 [Mycena floridula]|nr:hypothetical protein C8J56DRAFT_1060470 [Mycena floridula]